MAANRAVAPLLAGIDPSLLQPPVNVLRLSLHPGGIAPRDRERVRVAHAHRRAPSAAGGRHRRCGRWRRSWTNCAAIRLPTTAGGDRKRRATSEGSLVPLRLRTEPGVLIVHEHDDDLRDTGGHHAVGAGHRVVLPGRCGHRRRAAARSRHSGVAGLPFAPPARTSESRDRRVQGVACSQVTRGHGHATIADRDRGHRQLPFVDVEPRVPAARSLTGHRTRAPGVAGRPEDGDPAVAATSNSSRVTAE